MEKKITRMKGLDVIRVIACLMIVIHHSDYQTEPSLGRCAVTIFILLSGFLAGIKGKVRERFSVKESFSFAFGKLKKFYWLYFLTFFSGIFLIFEHYLVNGDIDYYGGLWGVFIKSVLYLLMLQCWIPFGDFWLSINGLAWYMPVCIFCYWMQPLFEYLAGKLNSVSKKIKAIAGLLLLILVLTIAFSNTSVELGILYYNPLFRSLEFFIGLLIGNICRRWNCQCNKVKCSFFEIISLVFLALSLCWNMSTGFERGIGYVPIAIILILSYWQGSGIVTQIMPSKIIGLLANASFCIYMIHQHGMAFTHQVNKYVFGLKEDIYIPLSILSVILVGVVLFILERKVKSIHKSRVEMER